MTLSEDEKMLIDDYRRLEHEQAIRVKAYLDGLLDLQKSKEEYDFYLPYINKEKNCFEIAEDEGLSLDAVRMRLHRYRGIVKECSIPFMECIEKIALKKCA